MTVPSEEMESLKMAEKFMIDLLNLPKVPKWIRERAVRVLRHYPGRIKIEILYKDRP